jgi:hypothetical protein
MMNTRIESLLSVEPHELSQAEQAELDRSIVDNEDAAMTAITLIAMRERLDQVADPFADSPPRSQWSGPAIDPSHAKPQRRRLVAVAAALLVAVLVAVAVAVISAQQSERAASDVPEPVDETPAKVVDTDQRTRLGAARPGNHDETVLATFEADTATIDLVGVDVPAGVKHNEAFAMTVYWRVRTRFPENPTPSERWRVLVHFDGEGTRFQADHDIAGGGDWWLTGEVVEDRFAVLGGHSTQPTGSYDIYIGWYKGAAGEWTNAKLTNVNLEGKPDPFDNNRLHVGSIELR